MGYLVAIDPSINRSGVAVFHDGRLIKATTVSSKPRPVQIESVRVMGLLLLPFVEGAATLVIEWPQIYQRGGGRSKGDPNGLLPLAALAGFLVGNAPVTTTLKLPRPVTWKGQMPKFAGRGADKRNPVQERCLKRLSAGETTIAGELAHDGWDAIGLGLWALGRWKAQRVFPGAKKDDES